jgi:hypothetical protein
VPFIQWPSWRRWLGWMSSPGSSSRVYQPAADASSLAASRLAEVNGHPARSDYKRPEEPDVLPVPDAFAVAPCTFNTVGKWAAGISDALALGLLNEALGAARRFVAVPNPHVDLAKHPAFGRNVEFLRGCGVQVLFNPERYPLPNGSNDPRAIFPWDAAQESGQGNARPRGLTCRSHWRLRVEKVATHMTGQIHRRSAHLVCGCAAQ